MVDQLDKEGSVGYQTVDSGTMLTLPVEWVSEIAPLDDNRNSFNEVYALALTVMDRLKCQRTRLAEGTKNTVVKMIIGSVFGPMSSTSDKKAAAYLGQNDPTQRELAVEPALAGPEEEIDG